MPNLPDAIILCGGAGVRLRDITGNGSKAMARVAGRPFLELLLMQLRRNGLERVILAVGYQKEMICSYFAEGASGLQLVYSAESSPLGTGGALGNAAPLIRSSSCLVMNGDSYTDVDLRKFAVAHGESGADVSVVVVPVDDRGDVGSVLLDTDRNVLQFAEKERPHLAHHLNAGIYMLSRDMLFGIPSGVPISLERELFPQWIQAGRRVRAFIHSGKCVDIGTPERYQIAQEALAKAEFAPVGAGEKED